MTAPLVCDAPRCPARAAVHFKLAAGTLRFCRHHARRYFAELMPLAERIESDADPEPEQAPRPPQVHPHQRAVRDMREEGSE